MTAGTLLVTPALVVDSIDYLLVDIATGRHLPGSIVHPEQLAEEHGLTCAAARDAIDNAWHLGALRRGPGGTSGTVVWTPDASQRQLHRLARAMVAAVPSSTANRRADDRDRCDVIDGEQARMGAVELFGLTTPSDVEVFLEVARALLGNQAPALVDELVTPLAILLSEAAQVVHGFEFAAPDSVRDQIVSEIISSLIDGRVDDFRDLVADYVIALSID